MTTTPPSRATLADLINLISNADLSDRQKQDLRSAVRSVARMLGADPAAIMAEPAPLRRRLEEISPEAKGLSRGRWANIRSLLGKALALARPIMPSRSADTLLLEWERLADKLDTNRRWRILPLLRFLSRQSIRPRDLQIAHLNAYRDAILKDRLRRKPEKAWDLLIWAWNACVRSIPGWPKIEIERQSRRNTYVLPWSAFPESRPSFGARSFRGRARAPGAPCDLADPRAPAAACGVGARAARPCAGDGQLHRRPADVG